VAVAAPIALLLLSAAGWLLAGRALRPVQILTRVAAGVTARGLDQRVPATSADREFQALIDVINGMLERLEHSFRQATRFSADAAHELKTPLTILQGQLQQALQSAPAESAEQRRYADLIEEVQRLKIIVRKLLLLAQADSGQMRLSVERVDLSAAVKELCEDARQLAPGLRVEEDVEPGVAVMADPDLLRQALQNLVSNAIHYNREAGRVAFGLRRQDRQAVFALTNTLSPGTPIDPGRLFERFYRGDKARSRRNADGAGLGLSLAREIVRAHQGDLVLRELRDDAVTFALTLPLAG
jgi:two-component system, OmpR family, heavy metal sensor histidine kinase CusS